VPQCPMAGDTTGGGGGSYQSELAPNMLATFLVITLFNVTRYLLIRQTPRCKSTVYQSNIIKY